MRRTVLSLTLLAVVALPASAGAQAQAPDDGTAAAPVSTPATTPGASGVPLLVTGFAVSPQAIVTGTSARVIFRLDGGRGPARVRVDLVRATGGKPVARMNAGRRATGRTITRGWTLDVAPGRYVARLSATDAAGNTVLRTAGGSGRVPVTVKGKRIRRPATLPATVPGASPVPTPAPTPAAPAPTPAPPPRPPPQPPAAASPSAAPTASAARARASAPDAPATSTRARTSSPPRAPRSSPPAPAPSTGAGSSPVAPATTSSSAPTPAPTGCSCTSSPDRRPSRRAIA